MEKAIRAELTLGMDTCMRVLSVLRRINVEALSLEMNDRYLTILVNEEKEQTALNQLAKLADLQLL